MIHEIKRAVFYPQNYTFFKSISDLKVNESIIISGYSGTYSTSRDLRVKIYTRDDFESLIDSFPKEKNGYYYRLIQESESIFSYKIKKEYKEQKSILLGFFIDKKDSYTPLDDEIRLKIYKKEEKSDDSDIKSVEKKKNTYTRISSSTVWIIIVSVIVTFTIIVIFIYTFVKRMNKIKRRRQNQLYKENNVGNNYVNYNNVTPNSAINDYNNSTPENNNNDAYYNKIVPNDGNEYDNYF